MTRLPAKAIKVLVCIFLLVLAILPVFAVLRQPLSAASITLNSTVQASFPNSMTFSIRAQSDVAITQLRLHYVVTRQNFASVVSEGWPEFIPSASVNTEWVWDMRRSGLPVGTHVEYWWTARDAAGKTAETTRARVTFDDTRYRWQSITNDPITLQWYSGNTAFANSLMTAAQQGLQRIQNDTGATPEGHVRIYIYANSQDLQGSHLFAQPWEGGVTFQGFDVIAVGVSTSQLSYGLRAVPHELSHWIVGQLTFNNYGAGLPTWLEEGLATYGEGTLATDYQNALNTAIRNNELLSVRSLSSPFSSVPQIAYTSYGQSNSIVTFMIKSYGKEKMVQLLDVFRKGSGYDDALIEVYGFDQDGLDAQWRQSLGIKTAYVPLNKLVLAGQPA